MKEKQISVIKHYYTACLKNYKVLKEINKSLSSVFEKSYESLTFEERLLIDAFLHRVALLQEFLEKLLRTYLKYKGYKVGSMTPMDILNTAEKLGLLSSVEDWLTLDEIRNQIVHEYSYEEELESKLKKVYTMQSTLLDTFDRIEKKLREENLIGGN